jgi:hypothetical protein
MLVKVEKSFDKTMRVQAREQTRRLLSIPARVADENVRHARSPGETA